MSVACASCGQPSDGRYCPRCGEERLDPHKLTLWYFVSHTLVSEVADLDGKIWRTLRLLMFRPGFLALEYSAGRRKPYVQPLRVLVTAMIVYALSSHGGITFTIGIPRPEIKLATAPAPFPAEKSIGASLYQIDRFNVLTRIYEAKHGSVETAPVDVQQRFSGTLNAAATLLTFISIVLLATLLYACFHGRRRLFVEHVVFSMTYFSFVLISLLPVVVVFKLAVLRSTLTLPLLFATFLWQLAYLAVSVRRFYLPDSRKIIAWPASSTLALLLYLLNSFFITAVQFTAGAVAIWML
jgi:hypothetical protein